MITFRTIVLLEKTQGVVDGEEEIGAGQGWIQFNVEKENDPLCEKTK